MKALILSAKWQPRGDYPLTEWEKTTKKAITGSSVWKEPNLEVKEISSPKVGEKDVLIKVRSCGVCGSDIHFYETDEEKYILYPGLTKFPCALGHEFAGEIVEMGKKVKDFKVGDMVCAEEMIWCGECRPCRDGYPNQCLNLEEIGFTINGAFAEYISIDAKYCWKIDALRERYKSDALIYDAGACVEPSCVAYNGIFECAGGFKPGGYVVVYGAGPIGLMAIALCKASGAGKIIAFETSSQRRKLAKKMGADFIYDPAQLTKDNISLSQIVNDITKSEGADMQVECAGVPTRTIPEAEKVMAFGGKIVQIGRASERVPMYLEYFQTRKAKIYGAQGHSGYGTFPNVIRMISGGQIDPALMITARYKLSDAISAIAKSGSRSDGKIIVNC